MKKTNNSKVITLESLWNKVKQQEMIDMFEKVIIEKAEKLKKDTRFINEN